MNNYQIDMENITRVMKSHIANDCSTFNSREICYRNDAFPKTWHRNFLVDLISIDMSVNRVFVFKMIITHSNHQVMLLSPSNVCLTR